MDSKDTKAEGTKAPAKPTPAVTYTGDGSSYVGGVPARDMDADEWEALTDEQRAHCLAVGLYKVDGRRVRTAPTEDEAKVPSIRVRGDAEDVTATNTTTGASIPVASKEK